MLIQLVPLFSVLMLLLVFAMIAARRLGGFLQLYALESLLLAAVAVAVGVELGQSHLFVTAALTVLLKVWLIPWLLRRTIHATVFEQREIAFNINVPTSMVLGGLLVVTGYLVGGRISLLPALTGAVGAGVAGLLLGLYIITIRTEAVPQVAGLLVAENGLLLATLGEVPDLPYIAELGAFLDVVIAALILGLLVNRMHQLLQTTDTRQLQQLRG